MIEYVTKIAVFAVLLSALAAPTAVSAKPDEVRPPGPDETLIYVIRRSKMLGGAVGYWIAMNDKTVARLRNGRHAVIRAPSGMINLNLAMQGVTINPMQLDDRPGEVVYLLFRVGKLSLTEVGPEEGKKLLRKTKPQKPIDEVKPNNEYFQVLANLGQLGFDLMRPATERVKPDSQHAVVTFFRRGDGEKENLGVWSERAFLGALKVNQGFDVKLPPGDHVFASGLAGTTVMRGQLEAGRRYYAWLDYGAMMRRVRLTPVTRSDSKQMTQWTKDVEWLELNPDAVGDRVQQRIDIATGFVKEFALKARAGQVDTSDLSAEHAY